MSFRWIATLLVAALVLVGCGGGTDRTKAQVRLVNASIAYAALDLRVDDQLRQAQVGYGAAADYVEVDPGKAATGVSRSGSSTALLSFTPAVSKGRHYTVLAYGTEGSLRQLLLDDNAANGDSGKTPLRVINAAPDAGALDIYLTGSADPLGSSVPLQAGAAVGSVGDWLSVDSTTWRLRVTLAGSKSDLRLDLPGLFLPSRQPVTLVLTPASGGVLVSALLLTQQGAITRSDVTQSRVRVAAGVADGGAVSAMVAGTALMTGVGSPAIGLYTLLGAGNQPVVLAVNGTPLAAPNFALAAGADYTLLVWGPVATPQASWLADDNRLPADSGQARLRLVNGMAALATPLAMTADFVPVADGVAAGSASAYASVTGTSLARLSVTAAGLTAPLFVATDQTLAAGANYSVFVMGTTAAPVGILRKDR
jgi:hypothetical protein